MGACASKPKVKGDNASTRNRGRTSSTRSKVVRSITEPPAGGSLARKDPPPSAVTDKDPPPSTHVEEEDEAINKAHDHETKPKSLDFLFDEIMYDKNPIENENVPSESMKLEPVKTQIESEEPETKLEDENLPYITNQEENEVSSKAQMPSLSSHNPNELEIELLASLASPKTETPENGVVTKPEAVEQDVYDIVPKVPSPVNVQSVSSMNHSKSEIEIPSVPEGTSTVRAKLSLFESSTPPPFVSRGSPRKTWESRNKTPKVGFESKDSELETKAPPAPTRPMHNEMTQSNPHTRGSQSKDSEPETPSHQTSLDASNKGVLGSMPLLPDLMNAELEKALKEPTTDTKIESQAKMEEQSISSDTKQQNQIAIDNANANVKPIPIGLRDSSLI